MAAKKTPKASPQEHGQPKFPYTTQPQALNRLLTEIPKRPKPPKIGMETLKSWSVSSNNNARTAINVLKKLGLVGAAGEPMEAYTEFMKTGSGPGVLGARIKDVYKVLFESSHAPYKETNDELKKLFNIHSGGGEDVMRFQMQTFKILADHATFDGVSVGTSTQPGGAGDVQLGGDGNGGSKLPPIQVDLHIHLPENKSTRDYEAIIQDIAKYIYGRNIDKA